MPKSYRKEMRLLRKQAYGAKWSALNFSWISIAVNGTGRFAHWLWLTEDPVSLRVRLPARTEIDAGSFPAIILQAARKLAVGRDAPGNHDLKKILLFRFFFFIQTV